MFEHFQTRSFVPSTPALSSTILSSNLFEPNSQLMPQCHFSLRINPRRWSRPTTPMHTTWNTINKRSNESESEALIHSRTAMQRFIQAVVPRSFKAMNLSPFWSCGSPRNLSLTIQGTLLSKMLSQLYNFDVLVIERGCTTAITPLSQFLNWMGFTKLRND